MAIKLSEGAIETLMNGGTVSKPILQILGSKVIPGGSSSTRYRLLVSDGKHSHSFAMLATQLNERITNGDLCDFTVLQVNKHICNQVQGDKRVLIILDITVLKSGKEIGTKIGNPVVVSANAAANGQQNGGAAANTAQAARPAAATVRQPFVATSPKKTWQQQQQPSNANRQSFGGGASTNLSSQQIFPIISLTPYQNRWTIRARVTNKSTVRTWNNSRGEGKLFSVDLVDESGEIRAVGFNDAVDKYYDLLEANRVYFFSNCMLKTANKNFSAIKNDYEISLRQDSVIEPCNEPCNDVPSVQYAFIPISGVESKVKDDIVDVIGVCKSCGDVSTIVSRTTNKEFKKREITLVDQSNKAIQLTLWAEEAERFDATDNPIVAVKGAKVSDFGGISLSVISSSLVTVNPDIREAHVLKGWYTKEGVNVESEMLSGKGLTSGGGPANWKYLSQVLSENLGNSDKPDYYTTKATVVLFKKDNCLYQACAGPNCNKKIVDMNNGTYRCEKCNRDYPEFKWRLMLSFNLADFSGNQWVTCFQEGGETVLGVTSQELGDLKENNEAEFRAVINQATFRSFIFKLRTKMESYNDEGRLKSSVVSVTPMNFRTYGRKLLEDLKK